MSNFSRFQQRNLKRMEANKHLNDNFIFKGNSAAIITNDTVSYHAAVVNRQEKDLAYVYTHDNEPLTIGSVWTANDKLHCLISEEIIEIKDVSWHKYMCYLCNIQINNTWGYFIGPEKSFINIKQEQNVVLESQQHPVLILSADILGFEDKIIINGRAWLVQEYDAISTLGLVYYSLRPSTVSKETAAEHPDEDVYIEPNPREETDIIINPEVIGDDIAIAHNIAVTLTTENGFLKYDSGIDIKKRSANEIVFAIPFGISEVTIQVKEEGDVVSYHYVAVD